jgi:hypothetical protein
VGLKKYMINDLKNWRTYLKIAFLLAVLYFGFYGPGGISKQDIREQNPIIVLGDYTDAEYTINGQKIKLSKGVAETEVAPGSASKIITRYFGNKIRTDLDGDGSKDVVFLLTQEQGGSGTFYYAVAALYKDGYFTGSDGYLLGDRIAPQTTEMSRNPRHKNVVVIDYVERAPGEPMTARPSIGKSAYLKLDPTIMQWGVVEPNFEGESR